jgi:hypothetical protein
MKALVMVLALVVLPTVAGADKGAPDIATLLTPDGVAGATAALVGNGVYYGSTAKDMGADYPAAHVAKNVVGGYSKDKKSYWAAADLVSNAAGSKSVVGHASALWEKADKDWKLVAFALTPTATGKQQKAANDKGILPTKIKDANGASGEYFMTIFAGAFGEDAQDMVSARKDVVLFGSAPSERYVTGAKATAQLKKWNLNFAIRDGITSGLTKGRILWIMTNLDARPDGKDKAKPVPYRAFLIFEGDGSGSYALVHANFAAMVETPWP